jgi:hypothetical protein
MEFVFLFFGYKMCFILSATLVRNVLRSYKYLVPYGSVAPDMTAQTQVFLVVKLVTPQNISVIN